MKKIILIAALLVGTFAQAQITLHKQGAQINDNDVFTYTTLGETTAKLGFYVNNDTEETVSIRMRVDEVTGNTAGENTGNNLQLCCFTICLPTISVGTICPPLEDMDNEAVAIAPGGSTVGVGDHFYNGNPGNGTAPVVYKFTLIRTDGPAIQDLVHFTYRYEPTASITDLEGLKNMGLVVNNTVIKNTLDVTATQNANVEIIDLNGKTVKKAAIANGSQSVDLSGLSAAVYIARFATEDNKVSYIRIVKN